MLNIAPGPRSRFLVDILGLGDVLEEDLGDNRLLGARASMGTGSMRLAQGAETIASFAREVSPVFQGIPGALAILLIINRLALDNTSEKVRRDYATDVGGHLDAWRVELLGSAGYNTGKHVVQCFVRVWERLEHKKAEKCWSVVEGLVQYLSRLSPQRGET